MSAPLATWTASGAGIPGQANQGLASVAGPNSTSGVISSFTVQKNEAGQWVATVAAQDQSLSDVSFPVVIAESDCAAIFAKVQPAGQAFVTARAPGVTLSITPVA